MKLLLAVDSEVRQMPMHRQVRFLSNALIAAGIKEDKIHEVATFQFWNPQKTIEAWLADHVEADLFVDDMDSFRSGDYDRVLQIGSDMVQYFWGGGLIHGDGKLFSYDYQGDLRAILDTCPERPENS